MSKKKTFFLVSIAALVLMVAVVSVMYIKTKNNSPVGENLNSNVPRGSAADHLSEQQRAELEKELTALEQKIKSQPENASNTAEQTKEIQDLIKKYDLR